jgi:hypothetical protein
MTRPAPGQDLGPAASWPAWVLSHPGESARSRARLVRDADGTRVIREDPSLSNAVREWNHDRAMWFASQHIKWSPNACTDEARRRAKV